MKIAVTTYPVALQLAVNAEIDVAVPLFIKLTEQTVEETRTKMDEKLIKYLPLSEATYFVMISLVDPLHGYGIMQHIKKISQGSVTVGPGTLYGILSTLEKEGLINL